MNKLFKKVILFIVLYAFLIALPIEAILLEQNEQVYQKEIEQKSVYEIESYAKELNVLFNSMEAFVNMGASTMAVVFNMETYKDNDEMFERLKQQAGTIFEKTLLDSTQISGLFMTFNIKNHEGWEEIWWSRTEDGNVEFIDWAPMSKDWLQSEDPNDQYYFVAIKNGSYWSGMDYEPLYDDYTATHAKAVYDMNGNLVGVFGVDLLMSEIATIIDSEKASEGKDIILFNRDFFYAGNDVKKHSEDYYNRVINQINGYKSSKGQFWLSDNYNKERFITYATLDNGWIVALAQDKKVVFSPLIKSRHLLIVSMLLTVVAIIIVVVLLIRKYYTPIVDLNENNKVLLISQSRQAKIGEMVGNIAHQWKQPLNSINIDLTNMTDDFDADEMTKEIFDEYINNMRMRMRYMENTITDFAEFLSPTKSKDFFKLKEAVGTTISLMNSDIKLHKITISEQINEELLLYGYKNELIQCMFCIIENAKDSIVENQEENREIRIWCTDDSENEKIEIHIHNTGKEIEEVTMKQLFSPYFTTKENGRGTGVGLYLTKEIIELHFNGSIYCINENGGVRFTIELMKGN